MIANYGAALILEHEGEIYRAIPRRKLKQIVCGDFVQWQKEATGDHVATKILPRNTVLERPDYKNQLKPLAANFDQILITAALQPPADRFLIDRYLVFAEHIGAKARLILNKIDLASADKQPEIKRLVDAYSSIGYSCFPISIKAACGLSDLLPHLADKTSIFVGQSGVGKSSIIKCVVPDKDIRTGALSAASGLGSHTTTVATRYHIPSGGHLIDSPGVREFAVTQLNAAQIAEGFVEFRRFSKQCRFNNCTHEKEPSCAVKAAVAAGDILSFRYENYLKMRDALVD
ncbi:MAG: ribosome small subunit-dependent GTPase A [Gammaproteobacteria bacterium]|nr:ribosome small subunit-dependent GTPase A [Gammaproteobacteria bacterium]